MSEILHLPEGKLVRTGDERYRLTEGIDVPADKLEAVKKQPTRMRKLVCPACGTTLRGTSKYKDRVLICAGGEADDRSHEGVIMIWTDDSTAAATVGEGE